MRRVESRERLVRQDPIRFAGQHAREQDARALAAGKRRDRSSRPLRTCVSPASRVAPLPRSSASLARRRNGIRPSATSVCTSTGQAISGDLRQEGDAPRALRRPAIDVSGAPSSSTAPLRGTQQAGHADEQRRFAGAVRPEHGGDAARLRAPHRWQSSMRRLPRSNVSSATRRRCESVAHVTCLRIEYSSAKKNGAPISDITTPSCSFRAAGQQVARRCRPRAPAPRRRLRSARAAQRVASRPAVATDAARPGRRSR